MNHYSFKLATTDAELAAYFALRQAIFVEEQGLFSTSDLDELDAIAYPIIAVAKLGDYPDANPPDANPVVGIVRIYEPEPGLWYGGRLGVDAAYRRVGQIGKGLIYKAVTTANSWGCDQFLATVQLQNVRFFKRLHWTSQAEITICDRPHHAMAADLSYYPPSGESRPLIQAAS